MRTSPAQFEMMVHFMEQHGDISKPSKDPRGKLKSLENWETLTDLLNSESSGERRPADRWKKVWTDLRNNCKKKAAKIHRAAQGTGGGPACIARLSDLEERVLKIIGPQVATGSLAVNEAGFPQRQAAQPDSDRTATIPSPEPEASPSIMQMALDTDVFEGLWTEEALALEEIEMTQGQENAGSVSYRFLPTQPRVVSSVQAGRSAEPAAVSPVAGRSAEPAVVSPVAGRSAEPAVAPTPTRRGHTPRRPRRLRRGSSSRRRRPTQMEQTAQHFVESDQQWRVFLMEKHREEMEMKERQLACQQRWQDITNSIVGILNKYIEKI